ncbi:hypothetical protein Tco_1324118, partial [Tanacetum coccineum]
STDTPYPPVGYDISNLLLKQRIDYCSLNNIYVLPNNTAYSVKSIRRTDLQQTYTAYSNQLNTAYQSPDTVTVAIFRILVSYLALCVLFPKGTSY